MKPNHHQKPSSYVYHPHCLPRASPACGRVRFKDIQSNSKVFKDKSKHTTIMNTQTSIPITHPDPVQRAGVIMSQGPQILICNPGRLLLQSARNGRAWNNDDDLAFISNRDERQRLETQNRGVFIYGHSLPLSLSPSDGERVGVRVVQYALRNETKALLLGRQVPHPE